MSMSISMSMSMGISMRIWVLWGLLPGHSLDEYEYKYEYEYGDKYEDMSMRIIAWSLFAPVRFSFRPFTTAKAAIASENYKCIMSFILDVLFQTFQVKIYPI